MFHLSARKRLYNESVMSRSVQWPIRLLSPIADIQTNPKLVEPHSGEDGLQSDLRQLLISLAARDLETRERLAADLSLFDGYHPEMQAIHEKNAAIVDEVIKERGWPTCDMAGDDGAEAAWLIVQHAIGRPEFQRRCLKLLEQAASEGSVPLWQPAMLLDRILVFEGQPQVYGTSFDWDEAGLMSPRPIADPALVDRRRAAAGLAPLAEAIASHRRQTAAEPKPKSFSERQQRMEEWARSVGWR